MTSENPSMRKSHLLNKTFKGRFSLLELRKAAYICVGRVGVQCNLAPAPVMSVEVGIGVRALFRISLFIVIKFKHNQEETIYIP